MQDMIWSHRMFISVHGVQRERRRGVLQSYIYLVLLEYLVSIPIAQSYRHQSEVPLTAPEEASSKQVVTWKLDWP